MDTKKLHGQFYTTNSEYILQGFKVPDTENNIIEPFTGTGELVEFVEKQCSGKHFELYDIEPKYSKHVVTQRDTLENPPSYKDKYVVTNPPYLARNKNSSKATYDKYDQNDMYKCFIQSIIDDPCNGGIILVPLNFWSSIRTKDAALRKAFLKTYEILKVNVFEERVFNDTSYTICSFQFQRRDVESECHASEIEFIFFPSMETRNITVGAPRWIVGQEIYDKPSSSVQVRRWVINDAYQTPNTNLTLFALDDGRTNGKRIRLEVNEVPYRGKESDRTRASLIIFPELNVAQQHNLACKFNAYVEEQRQKYHSLFLCNYRESIDYARKRISFDLAYSIIQRLVLQESTGLVGS